MNIILANIPKTVSWSSQIATIMTICNLTAIAIGRYAIKIRGMGPSIPISQMEGFGLPELLATTSLGHILGAGTIIGLSANGIL